MKAAQYSKYGGAEVIEINENAPKPQIKDGQVLVEVHAASLNPVDLGVMAGRMGGPPLPQTAGGNFSGVVLEVGSNLNEFKIGDEVYGQALVLNGGSGSIAEFAASNAANTALKPKSLNHVDAASLPLVGASAIQALEQHINLKSGQKILIHGGAGGIGSIAIQLAKYTGAYVATTVSSDGIQTAKRLGADQVIDYQKENFEDKLSGYDAVFNTAKGDVAERSLKVLKKGRILVSMTGAPDPELAKKYGVVAIGQMTESSKKNLTRLTQLVDEGVIKPQIDKVFPLSQTKEAFEYLETGHPKGKVVIKIKE
ncbi:MAG: NADP-dependent oxidoreductase [Candidatus Woykebacteria bacterium]